MRQQGIGLDQSNSKIKGVSARKVLNYTNTLQELKESNTSALLKQKGDIFVVNGKKYTTATGDGIGSGSKDESRYYSEQFKLETSIALSQMVFGDVKEELKIITGVPANLAERNDVIEKIKRNLIGDYHVNHNKVNKHFTVSQVGVVSQPVGTLYYVLFNPDGTRKPDHNGVIDPNIFRKNFLICDPGFGTTDLVELSAANGLGNNRTLPFAMSDYIADLYNRIEQVYPESRLSQAIENPYELDKMLINSDILSLPRGEFNVKDIKLELQEEYAEKIKSALGKYGYNLEKYHQIILTGGGSIVLENAIRKAFNNDPRIILVDNPIMANAIGFYILAKQTFRV
jgi:Actin like proteins N terminal domain